MLGGRRPGEVATSSEGSGRRADGPGRQERDVPARAARHTRNIMVTLPKYRSRAQVLHIFAHVLLLVASQH
jgi:hypothetical protein